MLHRAAERVDENFAVAIAAVQLLLIGALDAELADQRRARVGGAIDVLQIGLADRADVAEGMHRQLPFGVEARLARLDVEPRELEAVHGKACDVFVRHAQAHRDAVKGAARPDRAAQFVDAIRLDEPELHQSRQ